MGLSFYKGLYVFFATGGVISFAPTILLAGDRDSLFWQISIGSFLTNAALVVLLASLEGLYRASKTSAPATLLAFTGLAVGATAGLLAGGALTDFWYLIAVPAFLASIAGVMAGTGKRTHTH